MPKTLNGLVIIKVEDLQPGMVIDVWYQDRGAASTVKSVEVVKRVEHKYDLVKITMCDGSVFRDAHGRYVPTTGTKVGVWPAHTQTAQEGMRFLRELPPAA